MNTINFYNLYSLSKTLRFELIPQGRTKEHIESNGLIANDEQRAESYKAVKKIIDEYHKDFIDKALKTPQLEGLERFEELYRKQDKEEGELKELEESKAKLRKQISEVFSKNPDKAISDRYKNIFAKELIKIDLIKWLKEDKEKKILVEEFSGFTTYFTGFHENRKNMYDAEEKSTAIAYRLIHQNLPKFLDNMAIYEKIKEADVDLSAIDTDMEEVLQGTPLNVVFSLNYFNSLLTQTRIELFNYVLGGRSEKGERKIKGLNEYVNLYNQKQADKKFRIPKLKPLYKQILSDRQSLSFILEEYENDTELLESLEAFYQTGVLNKESGERTINVITEIKDLLQNLPDYKLDNVYLNNGITLTGISQKVFGNWGYIHDALRHLYDVFVKNSSEKEKSTKKYEIEKEKWMKQKQFPLVFVEQALAEYKGKETNPEILGKYSEHPICDFFKKIGYNEESKLNIYETITVNYEAIKDLLNTEFPGDKRLAQEKDKTLLIKHFLDSIVELLHFVKPLKPREDISRKDETFYGRLEELFDALNVVTPLYNKVRNHLTQRPYSTEKVKLNFENSTLLDGWDYNKETDNTAVLFLKDGLYYLAIMNKKNNKIFRNPPECESGEPCFNKMVYKLLPGANKMLPKVFFAKSRIDEFNPSSELIENYKNETHKKGATFNLAHCHQLIDFFKQSIAKHEDWKHFKFKFSDTRTYEDLSGFYKEVAKQGYKITFQNISEAYIDQMVDQGKLYLFQIYNKDFSPYSKGNPNLHTLYWKALFDEKNLGDVVYKLNGQAEVFYRKKSIQGDKRIIHKANQLLVNKNPENEKKQSRFAYDIVKDRRYTLDKFHFHVPITMNFKAKGVNNINAQVNQYLKDNSEVFIIGLDRGERHLLYLSLINPNGEIVEQYSLNEIVNQYKGKTYRTDYHQLLETKEGERAQARRDWGTIENIRELKEGYLSQVVHRIAELMVEFNAIVVMEDLNSGFKRGRQKVEKQVYQKFEKMLIDKLNYLLFKNPKEGQPGLYNAMQLANKFESFQKMGKQNGFIFYVPAWNTSKIDPATGFVDFLKPRYESIEKARIFVKRFDRIQYNDKKQWFEFHFDYKNFTDKAEGSKTKWIACIANEDRYAWNRTLNNGKGGQDKVLVAQELEDLFGKHDIVYGNGENLIEQITAQNNADFFKRMLKLLGIALALRHNNGLEGDKEQDYILSPVEPFFDSRKTGTNLPSDADANGAYHIAKKGLWALQQIREAKDMKKVKLAITNKEWLAFAQKKL